MQADDAGPEIVVAWRARRDALHLATALPRSFDGLDERLRDVLRPERVAQTVASARDAAEGRAGEAQRAGLRLLIAPYLEAVSSEATLELARAFREREPAGGFRAGILRCADPAERLRAQGEWERAEQGVARRRRARREVLDAAACDVGCPSLSGLAALAAPIPPAATAAAVERSAIAPLDAAFAAGAADRRLRFRPRLPEGHDCSDTVLLTDLLDHRETIDARGIARRLRTVARALDLDPDSRGPALLDAAPGIDHARAFEWLEPRPAYAPGSWDGPAGLAGGLEALGRAGRARVLRQTRGAAVAASTDPAFAAASGILLRRLVLSERFLDWAQLRRASGLGPDLRFEEAAKIRLAWARTDLACRAAAGDDSVVLETLTRAAGRQPSTDLIADAWDADTGDAATLRGASLAVLLEERLRTRSGHLWFLDERSPRFLREVWDAESGETAESVANALDLGTMDALLLFDGYRA